MPKIRASAILLIAATGAVMVTGGFFYPQAKRSWHELQARRAQGREFVSASESDQRMIVRSLLLNELGKPPLCGPSGDCPKEPIFFDRLSATLRSADYEGPEAKYTFFTIRPEGSLANDSDDSWPAPLKALLDNLSQRQTYNADPMLSGVTYVGRAEDLPVLGEPDSCDKLVSPRLVRISRAAIQNSEGLALVLVATTFCDGSGVPGMASLRRDGPGWRVLKGR